MVDCWPLATVPLAEQENGNAGQHASQQAHMQQPLQQAGNRIGRPIIHVGDPNSADLTDAERRRLKRYMHAFIVPHAAQLDSSYDPAS
jgi:hypothetical protein